MERSSLHIFFLLFLLAVCGLIQFASLCFHLPFWFSFLLVIASGVVLYRWMNGIEVASKIVNITQQTVATILFSIGLFLVVNRGFYLHEKYGLWDAWALWNTHAKFLADSLHWKQYLNPVVDAHPDYPLGLSSTVAFLWRFINATNYLVPFALSSIVSILIPVIVFLELYRKQLLVAMLMMLWLATDDYFIQTSLSQYADSWVALYLLCSFIALNQFLENGNRKMLTIAAAFIALIAWTKNEGMLYLLIWILVNAKLLLKKENQIAILKGMALPLIALIGFKFFLSPKNDLLAMSRQIAQQLTDPARFVLIKEVFLRMMKEEFPLYKVGLLLLVILSFWKRKLPSIEAWFILFALLGIGVVYLLTPQDLEWQLNTSLNRLLAQLAPLFVCFLGKQLATISFPFLKQKAL